MVSKCFAIAICGQRQLTIENKVKLESVRLGPVLIARVDEVVGTKLLCVLLLFLGVGNGENLCTKSMCPHQGEVTKASDTNDANLLSWTAS